MSPRILLITPVFYGIERKIKQVLEESDYEVVWLENKILTFDYHGTVSKLKFLRRIYFFLFCPRKRYIRKEMKKIGDTRFDILFSINGHIICSYLFRKLKSKNPGLISVLYLWDSFSMYNWTRELKYFDNKYTFDRADSEKYRIVYKPNFYIKNVSNKFIKQQYDLFFAGKYNPIRLSVIEKILSHSESSGIKYYIRLWPAYKIFFHANFLYILLKKARFKSNWVKNYLLNYEAIEGKIKRDYILIMRKSNIT
jgi:hypothetical protein